MVCGAWDLHSKRELGIKNATLVRVSRESGGEGISVASTVQECLPESVSCFLNNLYAGRVFDSTESKALKVALE